MSIFFPNLAKQFIQYDKAGVVVIPVPYEKTTSHGKGTVNGPGAILEASDYLEFYDEEFDGEPCTIGINTMELVESLDYLKVAVKKVITDKKFPVILGGEHTISAAPVEVLKGQYKDLSVVQFDAHSDLRDEYEGTKLSHACVMRRIFELNVPFVQIGIRAISIEERDFLKKEGLGPPFYAHEIHDSDGWMDKAISRLSKNVYLTFDVDAFDPSIMPGTGTPEPGGMNWYQVTKFFEKLTEKRNVVGADFVEVAPREGETISEYTTAKLIYKFLGYRFKKS